MCFNKIFTYKKNKKRPLKCYGVGELLKVYILALHHIGGFYPIVIKSGVVMKIEIWFGNQRFYFQLASFSIIASWQLFLSSRYVEPTRKMWFTILWIVLHRRKFDSRYILLIIYISSASQLWKHGYNLCPKNLLVTRLQ